MNDNKMFDKSKLITFPVRGKVLKWKKYLLPVKEYELAVRQARDSLNKIVNWAYASRFTTSEMSELVGALLALNKEIDREIKKLQEKEA